MHTFLRIKVIFVFSKNRFFFYLNTIIPLGLLGLHFAPRSPSPNASLRNASLDLNVPRENIRRCLKANNIKPFKPKFLHTLQEGDENKRLEYCLWAQGLYLSDRNFLKNVLFSAEASFTSNGVVSSQNCRYWATENPRWVINCKSQYSQKINVWCGILNERIIGPFF